MYFLSLEQPSQTPLTSLLVINNTGEKGIKSTLGFYHQRSFETQTRAAKKTYIKNSLRGKGEKRCVCPELALFSN